MSNLSVKSLSFYTILAMILLAIIIIFPTSNIAEANSDFSIIFPNENYIQSQNPHYIASNENFVIFYDDQSKLLHSLLGIHTTIDLNSIDNVTDLFLVGHNVLICTSNNYYQIDLQSNTKIKEIVFNSPENIDYITSDGNYIYASNPKSGHISVYDSDLKIVKDNVYNEHFKKMFTAQDLNLYIIDFYFGKFNLIHFNLDNLNEAEYLGKIDNVPTKLVCSDLIFATNDDNCLQAISKTDAKTKFSTDIKPLSFSAYGKDLYITSLDHKVEHYKINSAKDGLNKIETFTMSGNDENHLHSPENLIFFDDEIVIADTNNNRLAYKNKNINSFLSVENPKYLTHNLNTIFVASNNKLHIVKDKKIESTFDINTDISESVSNKVILDILYLDKLYILTNDGIYTLFASEFIKIKDLQNAKLLSASNEGKFICVMTNNEILMLDKEGNVYPTSLNYDFANTKDFKIDYLGNIFTLENDKITKFENNIDSLNIIEQFSLNSDKFITNATAFCFNNNTAYFVAKESFLASLNIEFATKEDFIEQNIPDLPANADSKFYKLKNDQPAFLLKNGGRVDNYQLFENNEILFVFNNIPSASGTKFAYIDGNLVQIPLEKFDEIKPVEFNKDYLTIMDTIAYIRPNCNSNAITLKKDSKINIIDNASNYENGKWLRAKIDNKIYFIKSADVKPFVEKIPEIKKVYGKAKADRIGGTVSLYSQSSNSSAVLENLLDGSKVEILDTLESFYLVKYNNKIGYIEKSSIQLNGLTSVQLIAIILSVVVMLIGIVVFIAVYQTKKHQNNLD